MFSNKIYELPSCVDYAGAVGVYARAARPRSKNWPEGTRPLKDVRSLHYAVITDGDKVVFRLHKTNVVEWHGPTSLTLDSSYDSISTRQFADRFLPAGIKFERMKEEGYVVNNHNNKFLCGIHNFQLRDGRWEVVSPTIKPKHTVLDKDAAALVNEKLKDFLDWIRSIWAVAGNDGSHPWVGQEMRGYDDGRVTLDLLAPEDYAAVALRFIPRAPHWNPATRLLTTNVNRVEADTLVKAIREHFYKQENCYIKIDYDQPPPRRTPRGNPKKEKV